MSIPITACLMKRALTEPDALAELVKRMELNKKHGAFTLCACTKHDPPCELTEAQVSILDGLVFDATYKDVKPPFTANGAPQRGRARPAATATPTGQPVPSLGPPRLITRRQA